MATKSILFLLFVSVHGQDSSVFENAADFCFNNGLSYISLSSAKSVQNKGEISSAYKAFQRNGVRARYLPFEKVDADLKLYQDTFVLLINTDMLSDSKTLQMYFERMGMHTIKKSILVFTDDLDSSQENLLMDDLGDLLYKDALFYMIYHKMNEVKYKQVLSLANTTQTMVQDLKFSKVNQIMEQYNLGGAKLYSITLSWAPYFSINNCDEFGKNCNLGGFLGDYADAMGRMLNFTWTSHAPPDGNWGVRPVSGPFNRSGVWSGALGGVINGEYHTSLSQWVWNIERYGLLDFVSTSTNRVVLALTPQPPEVDPGLFIRPFRDDAWIGIGLMFIFIIGAIIVPYAFISYYEETDGYNCSAFWSWMFFVLINAFYGGALTMFFTSELSIPFNSIEDVMRAYPDWKLKMMTGNDVHFQYKALQGDPLYSAFWDRVKTMPEETVFSNLQEGLDLLLKERAVIHTFTGMLKGYFQANPFRQQNLKIFAYGRAEFYTLVVPLNSPLKPILQQASAALMEAGTMDYLLKLWEGKDIPQIGAVEVMVLTAGQVILVFFIVFATFSCSGVVFLCELVHKGVKDYKEGKKMERNASPGAILKSLMKYPDQKSTFTTGGIQSNNGAVIKYT